MLSRDRRWPAESVCNGCTWPTSTPLLLASHRRAALFPTLDRDLAVDVAIVGGGIVGITAAYLLKAAGLTVALLERADARAIDTGHTTAHLTMVTDELLTDLVDNFGRDTARAVWDAGRIAIDQIESTSTPKRSTATFDGCPGFLHAAMEGAGTLEGRVAASRPTPPRELGFEATYRREIRSLRSPGVRFDGPGAIPPA